jgi:hypothetical protein
MTSHLNQLCSSKNLDLKEEMGGDFITSWIFKKKLTLIFAVSRQINGTDK